MLLPHGPGTCRKRWGFRCRVPNPETGSLRRNDIHAPDHPRRLSLPESDLQISQTLRRVRGCAGKKRRAAVLQEAETIALEKDQKAAGNTKIGWCTCSWRGWPHVPDTVIPRAIRFRGVGKEEKRLCFSAGPVRRAVGAPVKPLGADELSCPGLVVC